MLGSHTCPITRSLLFSLPCSIPLVVCGNPLFYPYSSLITLHFGFIGVKQLLCTDKKSCEHLTFNTRITNVAMCQGEWLKNHPLDPKNGAGGNKQDNYKGEGQLTAVQPVYLSCPAYLLPLATSVSPGLHPCLPPSPKLYCCATS